MFTNQQETPAGAAHSENCECKGSWQGQRLLYCLPFSLCTDIHVVEDTFQVCNKRKISQVLKQGGFPASFKSPDNWMYSCSVGYSAFKLPLQCQCARSRGLELPNPQDFRGSASHMGSRCKAISSCQNNEH